MPRLTIFVSPSARRALALAAVLALAASVSACGRRGPLEPPPGSAPNAPIPSASPAAPAAAAGGRVSGLGRDTTYRDPDAEDTSLKPATPVNVPKTPFLLDPLL